MKMRWFDRAMLVIIGFALIAILGQLAGDTMARQSTTDVAPSKVEQPCALDQFNVKHCYPDGGSPSAATPTVPDPVATVSPTPTPDLTDAEEVASIVVIPSTGVGTANSNEIERAHEGWHRQERCQGAPRGLLQFRDVYYIMAVDGYGFLYHKFIMASSWFYYGWQYTCY